MLLGCIGDDFTGSSDLANTLAKGGMRVVQYGGVPSERAADDVEAGVVALKSRTAPVAEAVAASLAAFEWLERQGCRQFLFKVCSTFDSTPEGNIGPVLDALMERLGADRALVCPAFPATGRSIYQGHLFVADRLLSESGMENHPLTPMRDPDIRRWLRPQTRHAVGHVAMRDVLAGPDAIRAGAEREVAAGRPVIVVDAIRDEDLVSIGRAAQDLPLLCGGSGIALGLPANFGIAAGAAAKGWSGTEGPAAILSGSCSVMTRRQVERHRASGAPALEVLPADLASGVSSAEAAAVWVLGRIGDAPLVFTSADPETVRAAQERFGRERIAATIEGFFSELARRLVEGGVRRLVSAGGETSGAVMEGLAIPALDIGPEIAPGVPAVRAADRPLWLALKSGNFGDEDFFAKAVAALGGETP
ncbi:3-oxo-tetronate kinase [Aureimonas leprariae]|uniref:3-oxo-tetronate kinase n=1 Tax=Plantimonas leprariae TaxID=2615207 RepID=A0A7V7PLQ9_9HYPH|nr:3-oxo-tetronate kinase [Aureimonas leprariae]KAB0677419.1 four-carbon acid sugar kinase family protein [Aureimonas leprariae]